MASGYIFISHREKSFAALVHRSTDYNKKDKIVHKTVQCWFSDGEYDDNNNNRFTVKFPIVYKLSKRLEFATGFNVTGRKASLPYQTTFYGLGGLCERHMDSYGILEDLKVKQGQPTLIKT